MGHDDSDGKQNRDASPILAVPQITLLEKIFLFFILLLWSRYPTLYGGLAADMLCCFININILLYTILVLICLLELDFQPIVSSSSDSVCENECWNHYFKPLIIKQRSVFYLLFIFY